jgi:hypothetical protein
LSDSDSFFANRTESNEEQSCDGVLVAGDLVMPGLVPGIHVFCYRRQEDVDGRDKPGHDEK